MFYYVSNALLSKQFFSIDCAWFLLEYIIYITIKLLWTQNVGNRFKAVDKLMGGSVSKSLFRLFAISYTKYDNKCRGVSCFEMNTLPNTERM